jgi:hypothetical protein
MLRHQPVVGLREAGPGVGGGSPLPGSGPPARPEEAVRDRLPAELHPVRPGRPTAAPARGRHLVALVAVLLATLGAGVGAGVAAPNPADAATRCGGSVPAGHIRVVVVVDDGVRAPNATCLVLGPDEQRGADAWRARSAVLGTPAPRYAGSGLLCAFDGYPAQGCGDPSGDGYRYWSYWSGTSGTWVYGGGNPHVRRLADGDIEGWRFVDGPDGGQNPPPRIAPSPALIPPSPPATTAPPAPAPAPAPAPPPGPGGGPSSGVGGPVAPVADPTTTMASEVATDTTLDPAATTVAGTPGTTPTPAPDPSDPSELAVTPVATAGGGSGGSTAGLVVGLVLIAALGGGAVLRARARR